MLLIAAAISWRLCLDAYGADLQWVTSGLQDAALKVLETARSRHNFTPEARHVNYVVAAYAHAGNLIDAAGITDAAGSRGWGRDAGSFNALLSGLVQELRQVVGEGEEPSDTLVTE
jgi:hypothetical protein